MPLKPLCARLRPALAAALLAGGAGCYSARSVPAEPVDPMIRPEAVPKSADAGLPPGKMPPLRCGNYVFYFDFDLDRNDPLFAELEALPEQVLGELGLPPTSAIIQVYIFETQERYYNFMHLNYKNLPDRRAYMISDPRTISGPDEPKVYTWMGEHLRTDLRHELTHALLRSVLKEVPLWLDEGLAGFFELSPAADGVNVQHLEQLARGPFKPDLGRLEKLNRVEDMDKKEYREAWAWVHLMLRESPSMRQVLRDYLQVLRVKKDAGPLLPKLKEVMPDPEQALHDHLTRLMTERPRAQNQR